MSIDSGKKSSIICDKISQHEVGKKKRTVKPEANLKQRLQLLCQSEYDSTTNLATVIKIFLKLPRDIISVRHAKVKLTLQN